MTSPSEVSPLLETTGNLPTIAIGSPLEANLPLPGPLEATPVATVETVDPHDDDIRIFTAKAGDHSPSAQETRILAQQLHTDVYLNPSKRGAKPLITEDMLNEAGLYIDGYSRRSDYHYVRNGHKITAARQVFCTKKGGVLSLPTAEHFALDAEKIKEVAGVERLSDIRHDEAVEISGLVARKKEADGNEVVPRSKHTDMDAVVTLYVQMIRNSLEAGHKLWLMNVDPPFARRLAALVGQEQLHTLGEPREYMGPPSVPVALNPQEVARVILSSDDDDPRFKLQKETFKRVFVGIDDKKIPEDIRGLLDANSIERSQYPDYMRVIGSKAGRIAVQAGMMTYTVGRDVAAIKTGAFDGNPAGLMAVDMSTSVAYAEGLTMMYAGKTIGRKAVGSVIAGSTLLAPYLYYLHNGGAEHSTASKVAVGALIGGAVIKETVSRTFAKRKERRLVAGLRAQPQH